ncbi:hypothetical protein K7X08_000504 [Anisodus acutangulus]|uniref:Uncharacterized protein n=1 Tax=Anisodus acutangulus TaxID=402998 RepID=A0A9Q1M7H2_9SOLA|nr:hypothetical protein K7X08_000504 [Anisodus acutangulus]
MGEDEEYIANSDCWSDDSDEELDVDAVRGVDLSSRRKNKKARYDEGGLTVMPDMQKGLVLVLLELLPNAERRIKLAITRLYVRKEMEWVQGLLNLELQLQGNLELQLQGKAIQLQAQFVVTQNLCQEILKVVLNQHLLLVKHMQLHNQTQFVVIQHLCLQLNKERCMLDLAVEWEERKLMQEKSHLLVLERMILLINCHLC